MSSISKENCLMHSQVKRYIPLLNEEDIPFEKRFSVFDRWINDSWDNFRSCCRECSLIISIQQDKMNPRWYEMKKSHQIRWN